jgi:hypothetical protein
VVGSVDAKSLTTARLRAMHRGQCSTVSHAARGVIVSPHCGQFKYIVGEVAVGSRFGACSLIAIESALTCATGSVVGDISDS